MDEFLLLMNDFLCVLFTRCTTRHVPICNTLFTYQQQKLTPLHNYKERFSVNHGTILSQCCSQLYIGERVEGRPWHFYDK